MTRLKPYRSCPFIHIVWCGHAVECPLRLLRVRPHKWGAGSQTVLLFTTATFFFSFIYVFNFLEKMRNVFEHLIRMHHVNQSSSKNTKGWELSWARWEMCRHPGYSTSHYFWAALDWCSQQPSPCTTCFMLHGLHGYCIAGCMEYFGDPCFEGRYSGVHAVFCLGIAASCFFIFPWLGFDYVRLKCRK